MREEGIEQQNREQVKTLGEKKNYKYLGIVESDSIKQDVRKNKKWVPPQNVKPSSAAEISSKKLSPGQSSLKIILTIRKMND